MQIPRPTANVGPRDERRENGATRLRQSFDWAQDSAAGSDARYTR